MSAPRPVVVLGATGSIGTQTLQVADRLGLHVVGIATRRPSDRLVQLAERYPDAALATVEEPAGDLPTPVTRRLATGVDAIDAMAATPGTVVVNGVVGCAGLRPSLAALAAGNRLALANKETLVAGGTLVLDAAAAGGGAIVPVDSEHSAIWQCLVGEPGGLARLVLTASGGPLRGRSAAAMETVTVAEALAHPTWEMGPRITVDSATMMNKALEVIEAHHLFGIDYDAIDVVVHPQSVIHSLVEFVDGSVKAQLGEPDMRVPIQYALTGPQRRPGTAAPLDLAGRELTFAAPDRIAFPCLDLGFLAGRRGGIAPAVLNAADEVAVAAFLDGKIGFADIARTVEAVLERTADRSPASVAEVLDADAAARRLSTELLPG
ncbi:MAG: 1-deoxy-D-xylulose-5-phosphate reductoisomerase [Acidimicrobiia bacterium]|nr:1-deoxy-D-xylulose-5-phosphate reductoisomerase [Acidimicrobiia bacterium]